jgi:sirohydrochlorin ferrochelatase
LSAAIIIFAHGSSVESANQAVRVVAADAAQRGAFPDYEVAFLDFPPRLREAVDRLTGRGWKRIVVVPYFLTLGIHLQRDLPGVVEQLRESHPGVEIQVTDPLDGHPALAQIVVERAHRATGE